jgi:hypothetical protein
MQKYTDVVTSARSGSAIPSASVTVKTSPAGATATIYSDDGVTTQSNPLTTDSNGEFTFYAADGEYTLTVSGTGITSRTIGPIILHDPADSDDYMPSADVSFTPSGSGAVAQSVENYLQGLEVSVFSFIPTNLHASIRDGTNTTDLTAYINSAKAALVLLSSTGKGVLKFPAGTYKVTGSTGNVTLPKDDGTVESGFGAAMSAESATTMPYSLDFPAGVKFQGEGCDATIFEGDWVYGTSAINTSQKIAIRAGTDPDVEFENVQIEGIRLQKFFIPFLGTGVLSEAKFKDVRISNCAFSFIIQTAERVYYEKVRVLETPAGIVHGGHWLQRNNSYNFAGGYTRSAYSSGYSDKTRLRDYYYGNTREHTATEDSIDAFFDTYFFKTTNSTTGTGYTSAPTVSVTTSTGSGFAGTATVDVHTGKVTGVTITNGGSSYDAADTVAFAGGGGSGAAATLHVSAGVITAISISRASGLITGDTLGGGVNTAMFRGVCGVPITWHSRYGRPNFSNSCGEWFVYGASRYAVNAGIPNTCNFGVLYGEVIGFFDKAGHGASDIMGVNYTDPYYSTRPAAAIYGVSGTANLSESIYLDPVAVVIPISTGGDNWNQLNYTTTLVTTQLPNAAMRFGNVAVTNANTLDWYEESTSTVTVEGTSAAGSGTYSAQTVRWTRIGNRVFYTGTITYTGHTGTGNVKVVGLPYSATTSGGNVNAGAVYGLSGLAITNGWASQYIQGTSMFLRQTSDAGTGSGIPMAAAQSFTVSGHYEVA